MARIGVTTKDQTLTLFSSQGRAAHPGLGSAADEANAESVPQGVTRLCNPGWG